MSSRAPGLLLDLWRLLWIGARHAPERTRKPDGQEQHPCRQWEAETIEQGKADRTYHDRGDYGLSQLAIHGYRGVAARCEGAADTNQQQSERRTESDKTDIQL